METKPTETKPTETKPADPAKPAEAAPYTDFKAPEGYTLDPKSIEAATPIFKELGLNQEQAQKLVDFHAKSLIDAAKAPQDEYTAMRTKWQSDVKADTEMGPKLDAVKADVGRAIATLPTELQADFRKALDITGAGDHPAVVKALWKLSQFVTEGTHVTGRNPSPLGTVKPGDSAKPSAAKSMYPNLS